MYDKDRLLSNSVYLDQSMRPFNSTVQFGRTYIFAKCYSQQFLPDYFANDSRKCLVTKICNVRYACMYLKCTCVYAYDCVWRDEIM